MTVICNHVVYCSRASFQTHFFPFRVPKGAGRFLMRRACFALIKCGSSFKINVTRDPKGCTPTRSTYMHMDTWAFSKFIVGRSTSHIGL
jgi:hypothetical protein